MLKVEAVSFLDWNPISFDLDKGEVVSILGESGSGKSLLLRAIADLIPHEGSCSLGDESSSIMKPTEWRRNVCYLAAEALWWEDLVRDHFLDTPSAERLDELGLDADSPDWVTSRLSMGERQRLGVLRMLDRKPKVLLLDEPTSNLDEKTAAKVEKCLLNYLKNSGASAVWVTHDSEQAKRVGNRSYAMKDKELKQV